MNAGSIGDFLATLMARFLFSLAAVALEWESFILKRAIEE